MTSTEWEVPGALDGERVDRVLALVTGFSRRTVNELLDDGRVSIGSRHVTSRSRKVRVGETLSLHAAPAVAGESVPDADPSVIVPIVWQDDWAVVVDKPAGLIVHPGAGNRSGTLVNGLLSLFPDLAAMEGDRPGIVHRLDKGTSGLLVVARNAEASSRLTRQLAARSVDRQYVALVAGTLDSDSGRIEAPLGRSGADPTRVRVQTGGRPASTRYRTDYRFTVPVAATLVRCQLDTGRTHQIRVHLAAIGHPVIGDERYGKDAATGLAEPPARPFLHAASLSFDHPQSGERLTFSSPLPADLQRVLQQLS
jgi:23S rRNA pseudouridine1911/1915/1917 synthase